MIILFFDGDIDQSLKGMHVNSFVADISRTQFLPHIPIIFILIAWNHGNNVLASYCQGMALLLPCPALLCGSTTSVGHVVYSHRYIVTLWAVEEVNLLLNCIPQGKLYLQISLVSNLNCIPTRYCLPQLGQAPLGEDTSEDMELCVSEPEHTPPDGFSLGGAPIAGLPALSGPLGCIPCCLLPTCGLSPDTYQLLSSAKSRLKTTSITSWSPSLSKLAMNPLPP